MRKFEFPGRVIVATSTTLILVILVVAMGCRSDGTATATNSTTLIPVSTTTVAPGTTTTTTVITAAPTTVTTILPTTGPISLNFDSISPAVSMGLGTPFDLVSDGLSAQFSSPGDPSAFSIQSRDTTFLVLSTFSGKYLYQNGVSRTSLQIRFNRPMAAVNLDFATLEYHGPGNVDTPSSIKLNAYLDSTMSTPLGTTTARGTLVGDTYPQGKLTFSSSGQAFNVVTIEILFVANGATAFLIDNILATPAA